MDTIGKSLMLNICGAPILVTKIIFDIISPYLFTFLLFAEIYITAYKVPLAMETPYHIFPWSQDGFVSQSSSIFLVLHILTALALLVVTWLRIIVPKWFPRYFELTSKAFQARFKKIRWGFHGIFCFLVLTNCMHLGPLSMEKAIAVNIVGILLLSVFESFPRIYFLILSTPALFELVSLSVLWRDCELRRQNEIFSPYKPTIESCSFLHPYH